MNPLKFLIFASFLSLLVLSCRKDIDDQMIIKEDPPAPVVNVYGNIFGIVVDNNNDAVPNATVIYNNETLMTDEKGLFLFDDVKMNANGTYVQIEKEGFFNGSRRFYPDQNATNYIEIKLLEKTTIGTVSAQSGGSLSLQNGAEIDLPQNGIVDESGNIYNGSVNVAMQWLDPTAVDLSQIMPGSLEARDQESQRVLLQSYGMLAVELESPDGSSLNLGNGGVATLSFPIPDEIKGTAPANIPLWYFDEVEGIWKEEGSAELIDGVYVGEVNHFTFWNCDVPFPLVELSGCFQNVRDFPLSNTQVEIEVVFSGLSSFANTNDQGCFSGLVPMDELLNIKLIGLCGTVLYEEEIGPLENDTDLGNISISSINDTEVISVEGALVDCDGQPINDGILRISSDDGDQYFFIDNGDFIVSADICSGTTSIFLSASDASDNQTTFTEPIEFDVDFSVTAGDIEICSDPGVLPDTYAKVTLDGESYIWDLSVITGGDTYAEIRDDELDVWISFQNIFPFDTTSASFIIFNLVEGPNTVTSQGSVSFLNFNGLFSVGEDISFDSFILDEFDVFISEIGEVGEPVIGTITLDAIVEEAELTSITPTGVSSVIGDTLGVFPVTIDFRVLRIQ